MNFFIFVLLERIVSKFTNKDSILLTSWNLIIYNNVLDLKKIWVMSKIISYWPYIYVRFSGKQVMGIVLMHRWFFFMSEENVILKLSSLAHVSSWNTHVTKSWLLDTLANHPCFHPDRALRGLWVLFSRLTASHRPCDKRHKNTSDCIKFELS